MNDNPTSRKTSRAGIMILALIAAAAIIALKVAQSPVLPRTPPPVPAIDYGALIQTHADEAMQRNRKALESFEREMNLVISRHGPLLHQAAIEAAARSAGYSSCCRIVYHLAYDMLKGQNSTEAYLDSQIAPAAVPAAGALAQDIIATLGRLDRDLDCSTMTLATDLAAMGPAEQNVQVRLHGGDSAPSDIERSLRSLGFNAMCVTAGLVFDAAALYQARTTLPLTFKKIVSLAASLFGKQAARAAGSVALAWTDGPLLVGDALAVIGVGWTAWDIHASRKKFEKELNVSLKNILDQASADMHRQAVQQASAMFRSCQELQDNIRTQAEASLSGGNP